MVSREPKVDEKQVLKAVVALLKHIESQRQRQAGLFEEDELLYLVLSLAKQPSGPRKDKPIKLPLQHPLHNFEEAELCSTFDLFLADDRILPSLPKLLGKAFFRKKKQPIPVSLAGSQWGSQVRAAVEATYMFMPKGTCINIKVAKSNFTAQECVDNIMGVLTASLQHIPKGWAGVRSLHIKTTDSVALPIFQQLPETPLTITA
ncbi:hypothetical protein WJX73_004162 [Symbiochloris irregularis]|uniref:Ribosomal protein L1 n=1 Tax=Symbiochloris irregularis TaxID=706552 RepID=A0AAW1NRA3_9CHLO